MTQRETQIQTLQSMGLGPRVIAHVLQLGELHGKDPVDIAKRYEELRKEVVAQIYVAEPPRA